MSIVPFPRKGLTVREMFARNHRDPTAWGIFAGAWTAALVAGIAAGSLWVTLDTGSVGGVAGILARALAATLTRGRGDQ